MGRGSQRRIGMEENRSGSFTFWTENFKTPDELIIALAALIVGTARHNGWNARQRGVFYNCLFTIVDERDNEQKKQDPSES